ncbi:urea carboxylase [Blastochloris viridis]|uniref:Acetyl-/propionyl-coenzyme A carboxylase alpha chain n=1 Tax=Blastochloris viridis TaxID=1079 RepID=A0A0H5BA16_BLAVI|nr:urea carboxylase [Blastochloris viridis]ALK10926.1 Acetyl-/propionyl-coenzyme A carboxylase alpha chain [Blastochloris viridis]BAR99092.1 urea carboxylase [Blastochloris viridis]CUU43588.1 Acetyl-/propionyl-coenzyme A carboxylase alpha chain [Blastochloris viridis]
MFAKVLIANRGAIACRVIRTLRRMGIASVAVYSEADRHSLHVAAADEAVCIGPAPAAQSYLRADVILEAALRTKAQAIHPGYGFLSENPEFAEACAALGIAFIGPRPEHMRAFGLKHTARQLAQAAGVPLAPGSDLLADVDHAKAEAGRIGYPVMLKSTAGGGGIGLTLCRSEDELEPLFERVQRLARNNFNNAGLFVEKFVERGRHIEVQIFGDGQGEVVALGERDCSAQRRNQKVIEETPAPGIGDELRRALFDTAERLGRTVNYANAGTVEFLYDTDSGAFHFLEVNTRLQVEHGVTEQATGIDLVEWMIRQAAGEPLPLGAVPPARGAAIQVRLYAEDPAREFRPSSGLLTHLRWPDGARIETWVEPGIEVSPYYDPMIAKIIVTGSDRDDAVERLGAALAATEVGGIETNLDYLRAVVAGDEFAGGHITTRSLAAFAFRPRTIEVIAAGTQTTVQDYPGRVGYWDVGVPPSGPMDHLSFRLANRAVGNDAGAAALEITMSGPTLRFNAPALICLAGADMDAQLDGVALPLLRPVEVGAGQVLRLGAATGAGCRAYLAVRGGLDVPDYLGAKATFTLGGFGGPAGRALTAGDVLHLGDASETAPCAVPASLVPPLTRDWDIGVLYGPHGAPDFFTEDDIATLFAASWEVHYNSSRTGVRLIGPRPTWARSDGGEAGLHPSNIHDNAYAIGTIDFTGDMPVILGPDGPSLGGFVCPATIVKAELWKIGQLRPGDRVRFCRLTPAEAAALEARQEAEIASFAPVPFDPLWLAADCGPDDAVVGEIAAADERPRVVYRRAGDKYLLVEYGPLVLDLELRFRVHALMTALQAVSPAGIVEMTPGIRSLQIHYDSRALPLPQLLEILRRTEASLPATCDIEVPTRIVHLPLSWDDEATQLAIRKYMQSVRADAPWCPSNIEFIRRINGLASIDDVKRIVFEASYLVLGLGDVYLGAPVATPIDPRHRLVTTKYNPARTWTPENAVGIGGAYLCVYGMEGPGGYQFVGRTCQMWNSFKATDAFEPGKPWLLRFFDQIRFVEVSAAELLAFRADFPRGKARLKIEHGTFRLADYRRFLADNRDGIDAVKRRQQQAFDQERVRWEAAGQSGYDAELPDIVDDGGDDPLPPGGVPAASPVPGSVWKIAVTPGQSVEAGDILVVVESMKMEITVAAPISGVVAELRCAEARAVALGQTLAVVVPAEAR